MAENKRYAIYDSDGNITNTIVCNDPDFAESLGAVEYPYPDGSSADPEPEPTDNATLEDRITALEAENALLKEQLAETDEAIIALYEGAYQ